MPNILSAIAQKASWGRRMSVFANPTLAPSQRGFGGLRMLCDDVFEESGTWFADDPPHNMDVLDVVIEGGFSHRSGDQPPIHVAAGEAMLCQSGAAMSLHTQAASPHTRRIRLGWQSHTVNATPKPPRVLPLPLGLLQFTDEAHGAGQLGRYLLQGTAHTADGDTIQSHDWVSSMQTLHSTSSIANSRWLLIPADWPKT